MSSVIETYFDRYSVGRVSEEAPTPDELAELIKASFVTADHKRLRPWRFIAIRGKAREDLGKAIGEGEAEAKGKKSSSPSSKPLRAPLLLAVIYSPKKSSIPEWEQLAAASGAAHYVSLALHHAGWGVLWRTGDAIEYKTVRAFHKLAKHEKHLGWLYVGGRKNDKAPKPRKEKPADFLIELR